MFSIPSQTPFAPDETPSIKRLIAAINAAYGIDHNYAGFPVRGITPTPSEMVFVQHGSRMYSAQDRRDDLDPQFTWRPELGADTVINGLGMTAEEMLEHVGA